MNIESIEDIKKFINELKTDIEKGDATHNEKFRFETMLQCLQFMWKRLEREAKIHSDEILNIENKLRDCQEKLDKALKTETQVYKSICKNDYQYYDNIKNTHYYDKNEKYIGTNYECDVDGSVYKTVTYYIENGY